MEISFDADTEAEAASGVSGALSVGPSLNHVAGVTEKIEYATSLNYIYAYLIHFQNGVTPPEPETRERRVLELESTKSTGLHGQIMPAAESEPRQRNGMNG